LLLAGCQLAVPRVIPSPLTYSEQEQEILAIAPLGTERDQVVEKLNAAGVTGNFGTSRSIYYCDLWNRDNGERWHMNVALLFDKSGKLYRTQVAQAETGVMPSESAAPSSPPARPERAPGTTAELKFGREAAGSRRQ